MIIRTINQDDLPTCAKLYTQTFSSAPWNENWSEQSALERLSHFYRSEGFLGIIALEQNAIGLALGNIEPYHSGPLFYLREMCTAENQQGKGIGGKVLQALQSELTLIGVNQIYLMTQRAIPATDFYIQQGFKLWNEMGFYSKKWSASTGLTSNKRAN